MCGSPAMPNYQASTVRVSISQSIMGMAIIRTSWPRGLASNFVAPMCSPLLSQGRQPLQVPSDLRHFTLLHDTCPSEADDASYDWDRWLRDHGVEGVDASLGLRVGASADVLNAAAAGAGIAIGKAAIAIDDLKAG
jgi:LysR family glycine cleavage system transcriptional activator